MWAIFDRDVAVFVEPADLARYLDRKLRWIEERDASNTATPEFCGFPESLAANAVGADGSNPGDDDATAHGPNQDTSECAEFSHLGARSTRPFG